MASPGIGFARKASGKPGHFREVLIVEKKLAASLAGGAVHHEPFSTVIPC
jgi:hypothetical protein